MSTILDSLKKSSNQRSASEKQSIDNFNFSNEQKSSGFKSFLIIFLALLLLTIGSYWIYNRYLNKSTNKNLQPQIVNKEQKQVPIKTKPAKQVKKSTKKAKPDSKKVKARILAIQKKRRQEKIKKEAQLAVKKKQSQPKTISELNKKVKPPVKKVVQKVPKLVLPKAKAKPTKKPAKQQSHKKIEYQYVYQLPFNLRKDIPKFKLNIHVYDENPENRIAIINGVQYSVDELIGEQVLVKEIVRQGVLLEFSDQVFLIPKL